MAEKQKKPEKPRKYTIEVALECCEAIARGRSVDSFCRERGMSAGSLKNLMYARCAEEYRRARIERGHYYGEKITDIADQVMSGEIAPEQGRVAIDALKWTACKFAPRDYGEKVTQEHTGPDGGPLDVRVVFVEPKK